MNRCCRASGAQPSSRPRVRAALALLCCTTLLAAMPAQAAKSYTFPGALPDGCSRHNASGNYNCGTLTLSPGDTIIVASPRPATIRVSHGLTIGAGAQINTAGLASDLSFEVSGGFGLGADLVMNASVTSVAAGQIGARSKIGGNIETGAGILTVHDNVTISGSVKTTAGNVNIGSSGTVGGNVNTTAGVLTIGADSSVSGYIKTTAGGVNLGARNSVTGNLTTAAGVVTIGADSAVHGSIKAGAGAVNLGANNSVGGSLTTLAGVVSIGANSAVAEYISTGAGAVNLDPHVTLGGGISTGAGVITIVSNATVGGDIGTGAGAVNIGDASRVCGNIDTGAGVVTLTTNVKVGGHIDTLAGAITLSAGSTVGSYINADVGVITLTGVDVGGYVKARVGAITLTTSHVHGSVTTGIGVRTITGSTVNDATLVVPAACSAAPVIVPSTAAAAFDVLETGTNIPWSTAVRSRPVYTKLAGAPFTLDVAALKADGTLESAYVTNDGTDKYVKLELFDDAGAGTACSAYTAQVAAQTATFTSMPFSGAPGRTVSAAIMVPDAHRSLLVRVRECADSSCTIFTSVLPACSSDRFSVRPSALTLSTTTSMALAPAPAATAPDTIRAGADFTLLARTSSADNYRGELTLDASRLTAQLPSQDASAQSGGVIGVLTPSTLIANASAVLARYSEVGYLYIGIGAYRDDSFTLVDSGVGDCITSTASNANLADTLRDGKYGCSIGNKFAMRMGRFVPDHFSTVIAPNAAMPCPAALLAGGRTCPAIGPAAGFVYSGQPFAVTITALSANDTPTVNYSGLLARDVTLQAWSAPGSSVAASPAGSLLSYAPEPMTAATFVKGVASASPAYTFPTHYPATGLAAPTDIYLRARENSGVTTDDVTSARAVAAASLEAGVTVVSGRLKVANNYGSELQAMPVMARVQYWDGIRFVNSTTDEKTSISALDVKRSNCKRNLKKDSACIALELKTPASPVVVDGALRLTLAAPGLGKTGSVDLSINSSTSPWLPSTAARIGVGVYKAGPVIYMREQY